MHRHNIDKLGHGTVLYCLQELPHGLIGKMSWELDPLELEWIP